MKEKHRYSNGTKAFLIILEEIFVITLFILMVFCYALVGEHGFNSQMFKTGLKYEDSEEFTNLVRDKTNQAVRYAKLRSNFESNGQYNGKKIVDIEEFDDEDVISGKQSSSVGYYLEDLIKWSQQGLDYSYITVNEDSDGLSETGPATEIDLKEEFSPARGRHLFDYANPRMTEDMLLGHLANTLDKIGEEYREYKELMSAFGETKTNYRFYIVDFSNQAVYTNIKGEPFLVNNTIKYYGKYLILDSVNLEYESNMAVTESFLYNMLGSYASDFSSDYYIEVGIDTSYPAVDNITENREYFNKFLPGFRMLLYGIGICTVMALAILTLLTIQSGYRKDNPNELVLAGFDKIKTEIAAGVLFAAGFLLLGIEYSLLNSYHSSNVILGLITGSLTLVINSLFLVGYFSLVRRIKAATLWSNSLCAWLCEKCVEIGKASRTIFNSRRVATRTLIIVTGFVGINWFFIAEATRAGGVVNVFTVIVIGFDIFTGVYLIHNAIARNTILQGVKKITGGELDYKINTEKITGDNLIMAEAINHMGEGLHTAVEMSIKNERLKADLITNVSHDIKTPLTSIINYVDLLKREDIQDEKVRGYIDVLDNKSQRLKHLTEDLVEASKISSGNVVLHMERINFIELIHQTAGELCEKFEARNLTLITNLPDTDVIIAADGRRLYRVLENIYNNVAKYALENTRVYADLKIVDGMAEFSLKNISSQALNIQADELTERFIRGDVSRSTEGSGLGLSIAKNLTQMQKGEFSIYLDGDLFKVTIRFKKLPKA